MDLGHETQGSLWRRWDPHVHLPGTVLNDQFGEATIDEALDVLASRTPLIEAVGVTDYVTTASFRRAVDAQRRGAGEGVSYLFPNVELRLDNATSSNHGVNVHLLCPPEDVDALDQLLGALEFSWQDRIYRAERESLIQLGRAFKRDSALDEVAALSVGTSQFKVNFEALRKVLRTDRWARESVLVAVAGGSGDGSAGLRTADGAFDARRQSIEAMADIILSSNANQVAFWQGRGRATRSELEHLYGGLKPCLHGSDAHDLERLGRPDEHRYSWIKGDASFDTLKLARLAPESRCQIGSEAPTAGFSHGRVVRVVVPSPEWFVDESVPINPGLVAIIGARGSGKTALADLIAAGAGSDEPFKNEASFIRRAGRLLSDAVVSVDWSHGDTTVCRLEEGYTEDAFVRPVRYLSQQFVERLCASDGVSDDLLAEIERVVFEAWPVGDRQEATNFRDLLQLRLGSARERQAAELGAVLDLSDRITEIRRLRRSLKQLGLKRDDEQKALALLEAKIGDLTKSADATSAKRLEVVTSILQERQRDLQRVDRRRSAVEGLRGAVTSARGTTFPRFVEKLRSDHADTALEANEWEAFGVIFAGDVDGVLTAAAASAQSDYSAIAGHADTPGLPLDHLTPEELARASVAELTLERARLQDLVGLDTTRNKQLKSISDLAGEARARIARIEADIQRASEADSAPLAERRLAHYRAYFEALLEEEEELKLLYAPLATLIDNFGASISKLRFSVRRTIDVDSWAARGEELLDLRRDGPFRHAGALATIANRELADAWESGTADVAAGAINEFVHTYSDGLRSQRLVRGDDEDSGIEWEQAISRWLYSTDHIRLRYSLEYDGLSIERLSPGTRGIVLLLLYLAVDQEETDPLIIDQPEENLDPESVYSELVRLFRSAAERRQIIMVTHNANLVVNTDVDQVIVAHCGSLADGRLPELRYTAGGLESPAVRRAVCEVLEGGAEAFRQRARRLGLDLMLQEEDGNGD